MANAADSIASALAMAMDLENGLTPDSTPKGRKRQSLNASDDAQKRVRNEPASLGAGVGSSEADLSLPASSFLDLPSMTTQYNLTRNLSRTSTLSEDIPNSMFEVSPVPEKRTSLRDSQSRNSLSSLQAIDLSKDQQDWEVGDWLRATDNDPIFTTDDCIDIPKVVNRETTVRRAHSVIVAYYEYLNIEPYRYVAFRNAQIALNKYGYAAFLRNVVEDAHTKLWRLKDPKSVIKGVADDVADMLLNFTRCDIWEELTRGGAAEEFSVVMNLSKVLGREWELLCELYEQHNVMSVDDITKTDSAYQAVSLCEGPLFKLKANKAYTIAREIPEEVNKRIGVLVTNALKVIKKQHPYEVTVTGGYRRGIPFTSTVDIVVTYTGLVEDSSTALAAVYDALAGSAELRLQALSAVIPPARLFAVIFPKLPREVYCILDLKVVPAHLHGPALIYYTGPASFNRAVMSVAMRKNVPLFPYTSYEQLIHSIPQYDSQDENAHRCTTEDEIFESLDLPKLSPTDRY